MFSEDNYLNICDPVELILCLQLNEISRNHERVPIHIRRRGNKIWKFMLNN